MSIAKLSLVSIMGDMKHLDDVLLRVIENGAFHPEPSIHTAGEVAGFKPLSDENPYAEMLSHVVDLGVTAGIHPEYMPQYVQKEDLEKVIQTSADDYKQFYTRFKEELDALRERHNTLQREIEQDEGALVHISHLVSLDVHFDKIFNCRYTKVRFGRMPVDSEAKLALYKTRPFIYKSFDTEEDYNWSVYFCLTDDAPEIDNLFSSLYFERVRVPEFIHGTPEDEIVRIKAELANNRAERERVNEQCRQLIAQNKEEYFRLYTRLKFLSDSFNLRKYVAVLKRNFFDLFYITGFVQEEDAQAFAAVFEPLDGVTVELKPHDADKRLVPPTRLKNGWFSKPFEMFVEMYGLPAYGDFDPTPFVAFTYCLLFGIMFGDLGQGLLLVLGGWLLWWKKRLNIARVINRIGIFSCIFGTFYGSVFGFEHLLDPFYQKVFGLPGKPIEVMAPENTNLVLLSAVALGVVLICSSILLDIYISVRRKDWERAFFSANGIAGFLFYGSILFGAAVLFLTGKNCFTEAYITLWIILPLMLILFKEPLGELSQGKSAEEARPEGGYTGYVLIGFFELFEVVLSFFSNTMSFLRVGGFVLSHAGMMAVVFTLSEMVSHSVSPFVLVVGNLFVIGMEGLIVGIQVLRLEFYEMFSRYFDGDGRPFVPIHVTTAEEA